MADEIPGPSGDASRNRSNSSDESKVSETDSEGESFVASDDDEYIPQVTGLKSEASDVELERVIEKYDSDEDVNEEPALGDESLAWTGKDGTEWKDAPFPQSERRNVFNEKAGAADFSNSYTVKETFKSIFTKEIYDIILRETNRKGQQVAENYNNMLAEKYPDAQARPPLKVFNPINEEELDAFFGILILVGVYNSNRYHVMELWSSDSLPTIIAAMSRDRFEILLRIIRFDNDTTREDRLKTDKAAPIREIWTILNSNLQRGYTPHENIAVVQQLFPYRGRTKFTQNIPSKSAKYGIKVIWICDAETAYPLQGELYTGMSADDKDHINFNDRTIMNLVTLYRGSGRNLITDPIFTTMKLAESLNSLNLTLVGRVNQNKPFLPQNILASKTREVYSTNFAFRRDATVCSYVYKKRKALTLLSSMHMTPQVSDTTEAIPEMISHYIKNKRNSKILDKKLAACTTQRKTDRWTLAFFYNMIDVAALAAYLIYVERNPHLRRTDRRRTFLRNLGMQLCLPAIETRARNPRVIANDLTKICILGCLGRDEEDTDEESDCECDLAVAEHSDIPGRCYICQANTRKRCTGCSNSVCDEHSVTKVICSSCLESAA